MRRFLKTTCCFSRNPSVSPFLDFAAEVFASLVNLLVYRGENYKPQVVVNLLVYRGENYKTQVIVNLLVYKGIELQATGNSQPSSLQEVNILVYMGENYKPVYRIDSCQINN